MINYSMACYMFVFICVFQAIITLIPAFLLIGIAWNLTLLYSGLFCTPLVSKCASVSIQMHYYYYYPPNKYLLLCINI